MGHQTLKSHSRYGLLNANRKCDHCLWQISSNGLVKANGYCNLSRQSKLEIANWCSFIILSSSQSVSEIKGSQLLIANYQTARKPMRNDQVAQVNQSCIHWEQIFGWPYSFQETITCEDRLLPGSVPTKFSTLSCLFSIYSQLTNIKTDLGF